MLSACILSKYILEETAASDSLKTEQTNEKGLLQNYLLMQNCCVSGLPDVTVKDAGRF